MERWGKCKTCNGLGAVPDVSKIVTYNPPETEFNLKEYRFIGVVSSTPALDCPMCEGTGFEGDAMDYYREKVL